MNGDFVELIFIELSVLFLSDEDEFNVGFFNIVGEDNIYDVYIVIDDGLFDIVELLMILQYLVELELFMFEEGYYIIYVIVSGSIDVIFELLKLYFNDEVIYMVMICLSYVIEEDGIIFDVVMVSSLVI